MGRNKEIKVAVSIIVLLLATSSCTVRKPTGGYLFQPAGSRATYTESLYVSVDTADHSIQEFLVAPDTSFPEPETEISMVLQEAQESKPLPVASQYDADRDIALFKESNIADSIVVQDLSSYLTEDKNLSLVDTLSAFLRNIKNEFSVIDYRMVNLENLILNRSAVDTIQMVKQITPERQTYSPAPEFKSRQETVAGQTAREQSSILPDTPERGVIIITDTVYVYIEKTRPDSIVKAVSTDSLVLKLTDIIMAVSDSVESLRRSLGPGYAKPEIRVETVYVHDDTSALENAALERNIASLREAYESEITIKDDSLQILHRLLSERKARQVTSDTIAFTAYYDANSSVPNNLDGFRSAISQILASSIREIHISAFTDAAGSELYNRSLSGERIDYIINLFSESGIEPRKILSQNFGELYAAEDKSDPIRRVEIRIITGDNL